MVTRFARRVHGILTPDMQRFTRNLTVAWCVFFTAQLAASALLYAFASLEHWSAFVNLFNLPLLVFMFAGQLVYRNVRIRIPARNHWQAIEAFTRTLRSQKAQCAA
jgi:uncharacterized membrane protein